MLAERTSQAWNRTGVAALSCLSSHKLRFQPVKLVGQRGEQQLRRFEPEPFNLGQRHRALWTSALGHDRQLVIGPLVLCLVVANKSIMSVTIVIEYAGKSWEEFPSPLPLMLLSPAWQKLATIVLARCQVSMLSSRQGEASPGHNCISNDIIACRSDVHLISSMQRACMETCIQRDDDTMYVQFVISHTHTHTHTHTHGGSPEDTTTIAHFTCLFLQAAVVECLLWLMFR